MVRNRKRITDRPIAAFTEDDMIAAVVLVCARRSLRDAAKEKNVNYGTYYRKRTLRHVQMRPKYDCHRVFSDEEEGHLVMYLLECAKMCYGLDTIETCCLAY
ncbi:hypothetical protein PR048_005892 [Dryococelus australis]|uniref:Transposase n=1 Tax=Dryococelus australis TaxID=614101 RepID=A0ABQ9IAF6_9NEOP|nr:hypothetical protein PR048_005892 [Dryococelus australis]